MGLFCCENKHTCLGIALISSIIVGIVAAFLQLAGVIAVSPVFFWVTLGIALAYLAVALVASPAARSASSCRHLCATVSALLVGILGTILLSVILLAVSFAATSVVGAIFVGILLFFFSLTVTATACLVKCLICDRE